MPGRVMADASLSKLRMAYHGPARERVGHVLCIAPTYKTVIAKTTAESSHSEIIAMLNWLACSMAKKKPYPESPAIREEECRFSEAQIRAWISELKTEIKPPKDVNAYLDSLTVKFRSRFSDR